ncbi:thermonuclease family protein [Ensifer sp. MJa1]|uniref:thermonuclease family protein n=1 Tax=Ensifer sp. MJa1 TaxID=2919888 RepID=UPI003FA57202
MASGWIILLLLAVGAYFADRLPRAERSVTGEARGIAMAGDGDSLRLDGKRIRIEGIDAPELDQTCRRGGADWDCGRQARDRLRTLISSGDTHCRLHGRDRYGRDLATCQAGGRDIGREMVLSGYAVSYGLYAAEEARAENERRGLWSGEFVSPGEWRRTNGHPDETPHVIDGWLETIRRWLLERLTALISSIGDA